MACITGGQWVKESRTYHINTMKQVVFCKATSNYVTWASRGRESRATGLLVQQCIFRLKAKEPTELPIDVPFLDNFTVFPSKCAVNLERVSKLWRHNGWQLLLYIVTRFVFSDNAVEVTTVLGFNIKQYKRGNKSSRFEIQHDKVFERCAILFEGKIISLVVTQNVWNEIGNMYGSPIIEKCKSRTIPTLKWRSYDKGGFNIWTNITGPSVILLWKRVSWVHNNYDMLFK